MGKPSEDSTGAVREQSIGELQDELAAIRSNRLGFINV